MLRRRLDHGRGLVLAVVVSLAPSASGDTEGPLAYVASPGHLQTVSGTVPAAGWAVDESGVVSLGFAVDGVSVVLPGPGYGTYRPDVCTAHPEVSDPNCPYVGWTGTLDTTAIDNGSHTPTLTARGFWGNELEINRPFTVAYPAARLTFQPAELPRMRGTSGTISVTVVGENGFDDPVDLAVTSSIPGVTTTIQPAIASPGDTATLTVAASNTAQFGEHSLVVAATAGTQNWSASATVKIELPELPYVFELIPDLVAAGEVTTVTVNGSGLASASISIPTEPLSPSDP